MKSTCEVCGRVLFNGRPLSGSVEYMDPITEVIWTICSECERVFIECELEAPSFDECDFADQVNDDEKIYG